MEHVVRVVVEEGEAVALVGELVVGEHGVAQAAGLADDRHGAVAQGDHLGQAARLELAGHEEHVRAGVDAVCQLVVHRKARRQTARVLALRPGEQVGVLRFAHAQHDQLDAGVHQLADDALDQVKALLIGQAGDDAHDRRIRVDVQAQLLLQLLLAVLLAAQVIRIVVRVDHRILRRIVIVHVDAVEDAGELALACAQQAVQALAVERGLNLVGVARGHGGQLVGVDEAGLHVVRAAVALQLVAGEQAVAQAQGILHGLDREHALILQVVDGVHGLHVLIEREVRVLDLQQRRNHAGLPVVAVHDVGLEAQVRKRVNDRAAEEAEALILIAAQAVDVAAAEVEMIVDEVEGHALILKRLDAAVLPAPAKLDLKLAFGLHLGGPFLGDGRVQRHHDAHVDALLGQNRGKRAHDVGQAARLDKRHAFGSGKQNLHQNTLLKRGCTDHRQLPLCSPADVIRLRRSWRSRWDTRRARSGGRCGG